MELKIYFLLQVFILLSVPYIEATQSILEIKFGQKKTDFQILIHGKPWLTQNTSKSSEIFVTANGKTMSSSDGTLVVNHDLSEDYSGHDILGNFDRYSQFNISFLFSYFTT